MGTAVQETQDMLEHFISMDGLKRVDQFSIKSVYP